MMIVVEPITVYAGGTLKVADGRCMDGVGKSGNVDGLSSGL
jgi:hypothetical protein